MKTAAKLPLKGIRVLDLSRILAGPYATMLLGDLGAEVIKIEEPNTGDDTRSWGPPFANGESAYFLGVNRNKKSVAVDLKTGTGRKIIEALALRSDVLIENYRRGALESVGLSLQNLRRKNRRLITCSIKGYGASTQKADDPGYDFIIQARSGLMSITGNENQPMKTGFAIIDIATGLFAATGIVSTIYRREKTGKGDHLEVPLADAALAMLPSVAQNFLISRETPKRYGNRHPNIVPYQSFRTKDGKEIAIAIGNDKQWHALCRAFGHGDLGNDPRFSTNPNRVRNRDALDAILEDIFKTQTRNTWLATLETTIPSGPIQDFAEVFSDPVMAHDKSILKVEHPTVGPLSLINSPIRFFEGKQQHATPPPLLSEHTDEILYQIGYSAKTIARLRKKKVIR